MDIRHLQYFLAVAEDLHFTRAAKRLGMAQPPLSQQIQQLERELGVGLFDRQRRRHVELTEAGKALMVQARKILAEVESLPELVRRAAAGESGHVSVGFVGSATYVFLPAVLRAFRKKVPAVELELQDMDPPRQFEALLSRKMQVGFVRTSRQSVAAESELMCEAVQKEQFVVALPAEHHLSRGAAKGGALPLKELGDDPFLMYGQAAFFSLSELLISHCIAAGFRPRVVQHVGEIQTLLSLVAAGLGVALVPMAVSQLKRPGIVFRELAAPAPEMELLMVWYREERSPAARIFMGVAREVGDVGGAGLRRNT